MEAVKVVPSDLSYLGRVRGERERVLRTAIWGGGLHCGVPPPVL